MARFTEQNVDIILENNSFETYIKDLKDQHGINRVFLIASSSVDIDRINRTLHACRFESVTEHIDSFVDPSTESVQETLEKFDKHTCDSIIAVGGGSVIDLAKAITYERMLSRPKLIVCPTTYAGTELTKGFMLVKNKNEKKIIYDISSRPDVIIVDPTLAYTLPTKVSIEIALDALTHCIEGYASSIKNPFAEASAYYGIQLVTNNLPLNGKISSQWREDMSLAGLLGSKAMDCGLGHIHTITYAIANNTSLSHGELNTLFAPYVMKLSIIKNPKCYQNLELNKIYNLYARYTYDFDLKRRYKQDHKDWFIEKAIEDSAYISHPVEFSPDDFRKIFQRVLS